MLNLDFKEAVHENNMKRAMLDGIGEKVSQIEANPINEKAMSAHIANMRLNALIIVMQLAEAISEGLGDEILPSEMLDELMQNHVGESEILNAVLSACVIDAYVTLGADENMVADAFDDDVEIADEALEALSQTVIENLPDEGDALSDFAMAFAYAEPVDDAEEVQYDGMMFDKAPRVGSKTTKQVNGHTITYKAVKAVRNGKVVTVNKRVNGTVVLTAAQRAAANQRQGKPIKGASISKRNRSLQVGLNANIYKNSKALNSIKTAVRREGRKQFKFD